MQLTSAALQSVLSSWDSTRVTITFKHHSFTTPLQPSMPDLKWRPFTPLALEGGASEAVAELELRRAALVEKETALQRYALALELQVFPLLKRLMRV